uniref:Uncharacterized protein n=1 Tax=Helianthus annuus TaxID=4232 RepID=A0A251STU4_HELAN
MSELAFFLRTRRSHWNPQVTGITSEKTTGVRRNSRHPLLTFSDNHFVLLDYSPIFTCALFQETSICYHCEYTRSLFPLYTLGCNMYTYSKQLLCLNKTYSIYERDMKLL